MHVLLMKLMMLIYLVFHVFLPTHKSLFYPNILEFSLFHLLLHLIYLFFVILLYKNKNSSILNLDYSQYSILIILNTMNSFYKFIWYYFLNSASPLLNSSSSKLYLSGSGLYGVLSFLWTIASKSTSLNH